MGEKAPWILTIGLAAALVGVLVGITLKRSSPEVRLTLAFMVAFGVATFGLTACQILWE
ncbi:hypothetical protein [Streptomyces durhamensis]|uniref:hypothetical protein n=1 Tax=Streptomyces durhamensis TaxID=68194 RepID=UPI003CC91DEC